MKNLQNKHTAESTSTKTNLYEGRTCCSLVLTFCTVYPVAFNPFVLLLHIIFILFGVSIYMYNT